MTVSGIVKLRPDLAITQIKAPNQATVGSYVNISATVGELNTDIGASADCILSVDGAQVDQALGIYVDAGDKVSCAFTHQFNQTGQHTITVSAANVVPSDWDLSNNSASAPIQIVALSAPFYYSASIWEETLNDSWHDESHYYYVNGVYGDDWFNDSSNVGTYESAWISGWSPAGLAFPLACTSVAIARGPRVAPRVRLPPQDIAAGGQRDDEQVDCGLRQLMKRVARRVDRPVDADSEHRMYPVSTDSVAGPDSVPDVDAASDAASVAAADAAEPWVSEAHRIWIRRLPRGREPTSHLKRNLLLQRN